MGVHMGVRGAGPRRSLGLRLCPCLSLEPSVFIFPSQNKPTLWAGMASLSLPCPWGYKGSDRLACLDQGCIARWKNSQDAAGMFQRVLEGARLRALRPTRPRGLVSAEEERESCHRTRGASTRIFWSRGESLHGHPCGQASGFLGQHTTIPPPHSSQSLYF